MQWFSAGDDFHPQTSHSGHLPRSVTFSFAGDGALLLHPGGRSGDPAKDPVMHKTTSKTKLSSPYVNG